MNCQVIVGNIGIVYEGADDERANELFSIYKNLSRNGVGRASHEPVTLLIDGQIVREYN